MFKSSAKHRQESAVKSEILAKQLTLSGQVQGVGFRPYIYRIAKAHNLNGWVRNCLGIVEIHVEGIEPAIKQFSADIFEQSPALAEPNLESEIVTEVLPYTEFSILESQTSGQACISVPKDLFLCDDCLEELNDKSNRRYRYPFINCTQCGPRYTLINSLPYDRPNTSMAEFPLCADCLEEYENPADRRFHAEPIACPICGPNLSFHTNLFDKEEPFTKDNDSCLKQAVEYLRQGKIVAVKGIGGYHLMCDAGNTEAVTKLRNKKPRPDKPLAIMFPAPLAEPFSYAESIVKLSETDKQFLLDPQKPILLVPLKEDCDEQILSDQIAPGLNEVGMMLPYSPLHHLLLNDFSGPVVATSANISGEPVLTENAQVEKRLKHIADAYLHHDRPIIRPADDPVFRTIAGKPTPIRGGRGLTPMELELDLELQHPVLAVGAQMKNTIALAWDNRVVISPHIGEMDSARSLSVFESSINDLQKLYGISIQSIICDAHSGYTTSRWAKNQKLPIHKVFHHHAHCSAAYYQCKTKQNMMVFSWDGVGLGEDDSLWGGETFVGFPGAWQRVATMRPFYLPGGELAGRQPWRSAAALCWQADVNYSAIPETDQLLKKAWESKINCPQSTSVGRLFDAAAALSGLCTMASYEGQGPMQFEALCGSLNDYLELPLEQKAGLLVTDWAPLIEPMLDKNESLSSKSALFHHTLAQAILKQALVIQKQYGINQVSFSGGVFQNRVLTERAMSLLSSHGFEVFMPDVLPVNDASISFGQIIDYVYSHSVKTQQIKR